jgi:predicted nicotinamide N-methyase
LRLSIATAYRCAMERQPNEARDDRRLLRTYAGDFPLSEYRLRLRGRACTILHVGAVLTYADESYSILELFNHLPYRVALWPAAIALAHDVASRENAVRGRRVLELGAGTGLPGIVAALIGGCVVQTDQNELVMSLCQRNGRRSGTNAIEYRVADWTRWDDCGRYEWILGSDILYRQDTHAHLRRIFEICLAPGGRILFSDPFRSSSLRLLEPMQEAGWQITFSKWSVGEEATPRPIAVYELVPSESGPPN